MFKMLFYIVFAIAVSSLAIWFSENNGDINFVWLGYQIKTSTTFFFFSLLIIFAIMYVVLSIFFRISSIPSALAKRREIKSLKGELERVENAFISLYSGEVSKANVALKALANSNNSSIKNISNILTAKLQQNAGHSNLAHETLLKLSSQKETHNLAVQGLYEEAIKNEDFESAISYAQEIVKKNPGNTKVKKELFNLYKKTENFEAAEEYLKKFKPNMFGHFDSTLNYKEELAALYFEKALFLNDNTENPTKQTIKQIIHLLEQCLKLSSNDDAQDMLRRMNSALGKK